MSNHTHSHSHNTGPLDPTQVSFADYTAWLAAGGPGHAATPGSNASASAGRVYEPHTPATHAEHADQPSPLVEVLSPEAALSPANALPAQAQQYQHQNQTQNQNQNQSQSQISQQVTRASDIPPNWPRSQAPSAPAHTATHTALVPQAPGQPAAASAYALCPHGLLYNFCGLCYAAPAVAGSANAPDPVQLLGLINNQNSEWAWLLLSSLPRPVLSADKVETISQLSDQITVLQANLQTVYTEFRGVKAAYQASKPGPGPNAEQLAGMQHDLQSTRQRVGVSEYRSSVLETNVASLLPLGAEVVAIKNQFAAFEKRLSTPLPYTSATQASVAVINNELHSLKQHVATLDARSLAVDQSVAGIDWKATNAYRHLEQLRTELKTAVDKVEGQMQLMGTRFATDIANLDKKVEEMCEEEEEGEGETDEEG